MTPRSQPPRIAEWLLGRIVGSDAAGRSILGDAKEEFEARGQTSRVGSRIWYWGYVLLFAVTYRGGDKTREGQRAREADRTGRLSDGPRSLLSQGKHAARSLRRRPGLSVTVALTLAVGIGLTTLAFAIVDGVLLRPLPFPAPEELVDISRVNPEWYGPAPTAVQAGNVFATPAATFFDWERSARSFTSLGAYAWTVATFGGEEAPERIQGSVATSGLFSALGVRSLHGRSLIPADDEVGSSRALVLSYPLWSRRFGRDPAVVGRTVDLDGTAVEVVGVMPESFTFPDENTEFWIAFDDEARQDPRRNGGYLHALGRLAPGVSVQQARGEMSAIAEELERVWADEQGFITVLFPRRELMVAGARPGLLLLLGAAATVLLVGCANVANLLLARAAERRRELAVHAALGAGRGRLAGLLISESLMLSVVGGAAGLTLAAISLGPFVAAFPMALPRAGQVQIDGRILFASLGVALIAGLLLGLLPALRSGRLDLNAILRDGGHGSTGSGRNSRTHRLLVASEVALSVLLLSTSGMFVESYLRASHQDRGFEAESVLTIRVSAPEKHQGSEDEIRTFFAEIQARLASLPGVETAALAGQMPYSGCCSSPPATVDGVNGIVDASLQTTTVTPSYFEAMGIPIVAGRSFLRSDRSGSPPVVVVSEAMARRYWPGTDPIGQRVRLETEEDPTWKEVVGVAGNVRYRFGTAETVEYYRPFAQSPETSQAVVLQTTPDAPGVPSAATSALHDLEPTIAVNVQALTHLVGRDRGYRWARVGSVILIALASLTLALAVLGVYGVLAYGVVRRTREIGIRLSLGGGRREILGSVLRGALTMVGLGVVLGLALAVVSSSLVRSSLNGVEGLDPRVLLAVVSVMVLTSIAATVRPALKALNVDPLEAFRAD